MHRIDPSKSALYRRRKFRPSRRSILGAVVFAICSIVTLAAWHSNNVHALDRARARFHQDVTRSTSAIYGRLELYEDALFGTRSFVKAHEPVSRQAFHDYVANLRMHQRYPGIQGIGYAVRVPAGQTQAHISEIRGQGFPQYSIRPEGVREEYTSIIYLEPFDWRNQRAFGYDMFTEPVRRAAMERARDTGLTSMSGKVTLVQETTTEVQAGFLMYLPVYRSEPPPQTLEERRSALLAYVYSPFRMHDLMEGVIRDPLPLATFDIFSGPKVSPESLMYRAPEMPSAENGKEILSEEAQIQFGGQTWTLRFISLPSMESVIAEGKNELILPGGFLLSAFFCGLIISSGRTEAKAIRLAEAMTQRLRESEERTRAITESVPDAIISADSAGRITYFNCSAERIFGYAFDEVQGKPLIVIMPERFHEAHQKGIQRFLAMREGRSIRKNLELIGRRKDGSEFPVNLSLASWSMGSETCFTGILQDITERKHAEEALRQSEERYRNLFELNPHPAWVFDRETFRFLAVNAAAIDHYGFTEEEFLALTIKDIRPPEEVPALVNWVSGMHPGSQEAAVWRHCTKNGRLLDVEVSSHHLVFAGRPACLTIAVDVTERKRAQEEIEKLNRELQHGNSELVAINRELESFSYSVSHDLRAPLRAVDGFSAALIEDCYQALNDEGRQYLKRIREAAGRMGCLIDDLLRLARITRQKLNPEQVDLAELANDITLQLQAFAPERQATFAIATDVSVWGDKGLLRVVLENLLANAWKFTSRQSHSRIEVGRKRLNDQDVFYVTDNGTGFDMRYAEKLFGAFQRLHSENEFPGTGIGLATVQRIVQRHGGRVWAESRVGQGATFYFTLDADARNLLHKTGVAHVMVGHSGRTSEHNV